MKFNLFLLPTVPATFEEREKLRPIGRDNDKYQELLKEVRDIAQMAEDLGFDALSTTEHHFHSEGYEASIAPLLLYTDLAARTERIKFASLGLVLPTWDPIRVAEEIAVLDHLTKGRFVAGFARGYQDRWTNVLGQHYHVTGAPMDGSEVDAHNRAVFEEVFKIMKMAWTQESIRLKTKYYEVPAPYEQGIQRWPVAKNWTAKYGAEGEVDENGAVQRICVVPKPYTQPHPPIWQPFSVSERTIRWCAAENIVPWILIAHPPSFRELCEAYREEAAKAGRQLALGESVGACSLDSTSAIPTPRPTPWARSVRAPASLSISQASAFLRRIAFRAKRPRCRIPLSAWSRASTPWSAPPTTSNANSKPCKRTAMWSGSAGFSTRA